MVMSHNQITNLFLFLLFQQTFNFHIYYSPDNEQQRRLGLKDCHRPKGHV